MIYLCDFPNIWVWCIQVILLSKVLQQIDLSELLNLLQWCAKDQKKTRFSELILRFSAEAKCFNNLKAINSCVCL